MKNFHLLDLCYPDYFMGHHLPAIAVPWDGEDLTKAEMMERIESEYSNYFELYEQYEPHFEEAKQNFLGDNPEDTFISGNIDIEESVEEGEEMVYFYFVLGELSKDRFGFVYVD